jgi:hypothetical protein
MWFWIVLDRYFAPSSRMAEFGGRGTAEVGGRRACNSSSGWMMKTRAQQRDQQPQGHPPTRPRITIHVSFVSLAFAFDIIFYITSYLAPGGSDSPPYTYAAVARRVTPSDPFDTTGGFHTQ